MSGNKMKNLKTFLDRFKNRVEALKASDNASQDQDEIDGIEELMKNIEDQIEDIDAEMEDDEELNSQKPLIDKLSENKNDFNIIKNKFNQKKEEIKSAHAKELLFTGQLKGSDKRKAERDVALDQVKEVDEQGQMLDSIHENVKGANANLENMNVEAKKQGEQIDRIGDKVITMDNTVKKTGNVMSDIERRICCRKCMVWVAIILVILMNIIMAFLIFAKMFGWPGFPKSEQKKEEESGGGNNEDKDTKGVSFDYTKNIDYNKFGSNSISFVILKAGTATNIDGQLENNYKEAQKKNINFGLFWVIDDTTDIISQVEKANNFINEQIKEKNRELKYKFYFKITISTAFEHPETINDYCDHVEKGYCGIVVSASTFKNNIKGKIQSLNKITQIWIDSYDKDLDVKDSNIIQLYNVDKEVTLGDKFTIIKAKS